MAERIHATLKLDDILSFIDTMAFSKIRVQKLKRQLEQKQAEVERCRRFKKGLYEAYIDGTVSKEDYDLFYADYAQEGSDATAQIKRIQSDIEAILSNTDEYGLWLERFKKHHNLSELTRPIVLELVDSIFVHSKDVIEITFRFQSEYEKLLGFIENDAYISDNLAKQEVV